MTLKTEQVEKAIYESRQVMTCDGPGCEQRSEINDALGWRYVSLVRDALYERQSYHFCSMQCLARWTADAAG